MDTRAVLYGFAGLVLGACSSSTPTAAAGTTGCTPGQSVACIGPGGCPGGQICSATGASFDACVCAAQADASLQTVPDAIAPDADGKVADVAAPFVVPDGGFVDPYMGSPSPASEIVKAGTSIRAVDLAFVVQTTGSTSGYLPTLMQNVSTTILPALTKAIPQLAFGVVDYRDCGDTWAVKVLQTMTTDVTSVRAAIATMTAGGGGDEPESQIGAMQYALTGEAISCTGMPAASGGVEFRPGAKRVIALFSNSHWHDPDANLTLAGLRAAFNTSNATFVSMLDMENMDVYPDLEDVPNAFSDATKSNVPTAAFSAGGCGAGVCCTGSGGAARPPGGPGGTCRLNFLLLSGLEPAAPLVEAMQAISVGTVLDVTTAVANDPANPSGSDATSLFEPVRAMGEGDPTSGCPAQPAKDTNGDGVTDTFTAVTVGTPVCFEIRPKTNAAIPGGTGAQTLGLRLTVLGMPGSVVLDERTITVVVPPA